MAELQIRNVGNMWRVTRGETVLAFATDYPMALEKRRNLMATGTAGLARPIALTREKPCQN